MDVAATGVSIFVPRPTNGSRLLHFPTSKLLCTSKQVHTHGRLSLGISSRRRTRGFVVRATTSDHNNNNKIAPLHFQSPIGQFLSQILINHPHLMPAAVDQQLNQLQSDRDADPAHTTSTDLVLYRRIAEVKANERRTALEEILYSLVVQKFMDANISLIPQDLSATLDSWANEVGKLENLHSQEAYEMIQNHLALILGNRAGDLSSVAQISKLRVGQVYAASVMYGYFLKRVDERFQLEKSINVLPNVPQQSADHQTIMDDVRPATQVGDASPGGFGYGIKPTRLRNYVMSFDADTLQRYATIRSKEAVSIIEKHTEALFGRPEMVITPEGAVDYSKDENIKISFGGLRRLVLEAVTFGCFLWDVEGYVDSRYHFVFN
ncbi:unnamed protein product [Vicia faba]|uniref:Uncharacterized protein n=1 Tax=Vicia faba TaxID=3906 RepID=A0AAV1BEU8_VICFA|nr:unnamed protein product [Vicia faba]